MKITIENFLKLHKSIRLNIIDIREHNSYIISHIPNSINISAKYLLVYPHKNLDKNKDYYIYCQYGEKSAKCAQQLSDLGYKVYNIEGGYNAYIRY